MILSVVFLAASFLMFFQLIQPAYSDVQTLKGKELSTKSALEKEQQAIEQAKTLIAQYQSESQAQNNLALAMPAGPNVAGALAQLYGIAQNNGIAINAMSVSAPAIQLAQGAQQKSGTASGGGQIIKPRGTVSIQVSALGSYENLKSFIAQIETNLRVFDLTSFSIQAPSGGVAVVDSGGKGAPAANPDLFGYNITVVTYYQLP